MRWWRSAAHSIPSRAVDGWFAQSEVNGKPSGWKAFYDGGKWKVEDKR
ncbi:MAG: hypothetical protein AB1532_13975 [Pseudomonadota bacterium]